VFLDPNFTLGRAFLFVPAGVVALVVAGWLAHAIGSMSAWQVRSLLVPGLSRRHPKWRCWCGGGRCGSISASPAGSSS
jgi:hypothetical protein